MIVFIKFVNKCEADVTAYMLTSKTHVSFFLRMLLILKFRIEYIIIFLTFKIPTNLHKENCLVH